MAASASNFVREARSFLAMFLHHSRGQLWQSVGLMLLGGMLESVGLLLLVPLAGLLVKGGGRAQAIAAHLFDALHAETQLARLAVVLAIFVPVVVLRAVVLTLRDVRLATLQLDFVEQQRIGLMRALADARWQDIARLRHARVTNAIGSDIQRIGAATHYLLQTVVAIVMLAAQWLLTLWIAPVCALAAVLLLAGGAVLLVPSLRRASRVGGDLTVDQLRMMHTSGQFLSGLKLAMAQNAQAAFARDFEDGARQLTRSQLVFQQRQSLGRVGMASASALVGAAVLTIGVWQALPIATLLPAIVILSRMSGPAMLIQQSIQQLASLIPAQTSFVALLRDLEGNPSLPSLASPVSHGDGIVFDQVSYAHEDGGGVTAVDVTLQPGEVVGVVGRSGAGKTTFVDLLVGLIEPDDGTILVGGVLLDRHNAARHRDRIAYVAQDNHLLHDTIRANLTLGGPVVDDAALWGALAQVGAADLVRATAVGLDTLVAERGIRMSGGERQRIALARALLRRPALLILDEATNAIDIPGERAILSDIAAMPDCPTMVIVAHRIETLAMCDRILTFDRGRLVDDRRVTQPSVLP